MSRAERVGTILLRSQAAEWLRQADALTAERERALLLVELAVLTITAEHDPGEHSTAALVRLTLVAGRCAAPSLTSSRQGPITDDINEVLNQARRAVLGSPPWEPEP